MLCGVRRWEKGACPIPFLILLTVARLSCSQVLPSATVEERIRPAKVDGEATARAASNGARAAAGVVMEFSVVGPMSSTRRKKAKQNSAQSAENPQ